MNSAEAIPKSPRGFAWLLVLLAILIIGILVVMPLILVFREALSHGPAAYLRAVSDPFTIEAVKLTLFAAAIAVPLNTIFGLAVAWLVTRFKFRGRSYLLTAIDAPLAISPVIAGLMIVLLFGARGLFGPLLDTMGISIVFAVPGIVIATIFVTFPFVARELIPLMQEQGLEAEEAALTLGASGWQLFRFITLPSIIWGLMYGVLLCLSRAVGEFGAVSVVSGHIRGETTTLPLHVEILYNEYSFVGAFAAASLLSLVAVASLALQRILQSRVR